MLKVRMLRVVAFFLSISLHAQNPLVIPDTLSGTTFSLTAQKGTKVFFTGYTTNTFGYNGNFLGPTLFMNKGDSVVLHVTNNLSMETTTHWHGFHVAPGNDGGPYQPIAVGATWSPSFKVRNNAGTYWYHPHLHEKTEIQVSKGMAGLIIVRDDVEKNYVLPRTYGVDDFPLIVQTRIFDFFHQIGTATHEDTVPMINGTINPYLQVPKQVVRLRLLNGSTDRTYNFGMSTNADFYVIASDGGLLEKPFSTKRLQLAVGERAEILVDFSNDTLGQKSYLMSYGAELPRGVIGADSVGTSQLVIQEGYYQNFLNGSNFNLLQFQVIAPTSNPVVSIPNSFAAIPAISPASATVTRQVIFTPDTVTSGLQGYVDGPFHFNGKTFNMDSINVRTYLNNTEIWSLENKTLVAHPFHIHDVQFLILDINGNPPPPELSGYKDVVLVKPYETVRFITRFENFADSTTPYMYHCHLLHHEDDGMMGTFLVLDTGKVFTRTPLINPEKNSFFVYQDLQHQLLKVYVNMENTTTARISVVDVLGREQQCLKEGMLSQGSHEYTADISALKPGIYFVIYQGDSFQRSKILRNF